MTVAQLQGSVFSRVEVEEVVEKSRSLMLVWFLSLVSEDADLVCQAGDEEKELLAVLLEAGCDSSCCFYSAAC